MPITSRSQSDNGAATTVSAAGAIAIAVLLASRGSMQQAPQQPATSAVRHSRLQPACAVPPLRQAAGEAAASAVARSSKLLHGSPQRLQSARYTRVAATSAGTATAA